MSDWSLESLGPFVIHTKGFAFKSKAYKESGVPVVKVKNFTSDSIDLSDCVFIAMDESQDYQKVTLEEDDVVIATVGSWLTNPNSVVGKTVRVPISAAKCLLNQNAVRLKAKKRMNQKFLFYLLKHDKFKYYIVGTAQGSANQASITLNDIFNYQFDLPPLPEQKAIAHILGTLDDKIELNRRQNETLEAMAQALFKSWFVDFDPVLDNALAAGNTIPPALQKKAAQRQAVADEKKLAAKNPALAQLFPASFEFNDELGKWVPEGWEVKSLDELVKLTGGGTPKTSVEEYWNGIIPWFSVVDAPLESDVFVINTGKKVTPLGVENSATKVLPEWTTIITARGTVGKCAIVGVPMAMNQSCYGINCKSKDQDIFTYLLIRKSVSDLQNKSHGSVFSTITGDTFRSIYIALPSDSFLQESFEKYVSPSFFKIRSNCFEVDSLKKVRETLLPQLISGKIKVNAK